MMQRPDCNQVGDVNGFCFGGGGVGHALQCVLILNVFAIEYISACGTDMIGVISSVILKWDAITQQKSLST